MYLTYTYLSIKTIIVIEAIKRIIPWSVMKNIISYISETQLIHGHLLQELSSTTTLVSYVFFFKTHTILII